METGVAVFVLRRQENRTQVLLLERAHGEFEGTWCPVAGTPRPDEREADAALRELREETGLTADRFYAAPFSAWTESGASAQGVPMRLAVFVAFVASDVPVQLDREHTRAAWLDFEEAARRLPLEGQRSVLARIRTAFVGSAPDEALRLC